MALNPNIILSGMPQPFDTNALLQQQISGMENINALERQRRADELAMQDRAAAHPKVTIHYNTAVEDAFGDGVLQGLTTVNTATGDRGAEQQQQQQKQKQPQASEEWQLWSRLWRC